MGGIDFFTTTKFTTKKNLIFFPRTVETPSVMFHDIRRARDICSETIFETTVVEFFVATNRFRSLNPCAIAGGDGRVQRA